MPWRTKRLSACPNPGPKRNSPMAAPMASFSAREHTLTLISDWARSTASRWVKWTTYTGTRSVASRVSMVSCSAVWRYSYSSGTGRVALRIGGGGAAGPLAELDLEPAGVAERRRHQHELGLGQREQRHLPRPAAVGVGVVVELVHHDLADVGPLAVAQRQVGEDLGRAADDRRVGVHRGVAGEHADVVGAQLVHEVEELLGHQRLDRRRVERAAARRRGRRRGRPAPRATSPTRSACPRITLAPAHDLEHRLLLRRVQRQAAALGPGRERVEHGVGLGVGAERRQVVGQGAGHDAQRSVEVHGGGRASAVGPSRSASRRRRARSTAPRCAPASRTALT